MPVPDGSQLCKVCSDLLDSYSGEVASLCCFNSRIFETFIGNACWLASSWLSLYSNAVAAGMKGINTAKMPVVMFVQLQYMLALGQNGICLKNISGNPDNHQDPTMLVLTSI